MINEEMLKILGCPVCKSPLEWLKEEKQLLCTNDTCGKRYPIGPNDVPILVPDIEKYEKDYGVKYTQA